MARAVAEEITVEFFEKLRQKGRDCVETLEKINRLIKEDDEYQRSMLEGMKAIITHMQKGGNTLCAEVPLESGANEIFKDLMKKYQIPFVSAKTGDLKKEHIFYRDKDTKIVAMCRIELLKTLNLMCEELSPKDFFKRYSNDEIKGVSGLDKADIEFIRREISDKNDKSMEIEYSVVKDLKTEGKEMIIFPESLEEVINGIIDRVMFDFSGDEGKRNKDTVLKMVNEKQRLQNIINNNVNAGKEVCLVDSINPNIFCLINEKGIYYHCLQKDVRKTEDGREEEYIKDDVTYSSDRNSLSRFSSGLYKPVIMSLREVNIIKGIEKDGEIKTDLEKFDEDLRILKKKTLILPEQRRFFADTVINNLRKPLNQRIKTYVRLPEDAIRGITELVKQKNLTETVIKNDEVSVTESEVSVIEKYIRDNVFRSYKPLEITELTPLREYELKFFYEGRGEINLTDKEKLKAESQFIVDANDERYLFKISEEGLVAYDKKAEFLRISISDEDYTDKIKQILDNLTEPVILKEDDIKGKTDYEILERIKELRPDIKEFESKVTLRSNITKRFNKEFSEMRRVSPDELTKRQAEALEKIKYYRENTETIKYSEATKDLYKEPDRLITVNTKDMSLNL